MSEEEHRLKGAKDRMSAAYTHRRGNTVSVSARDIFLLLDALQAQEKGNKESRPKLNWRRNHLYLGNLHMFTIRVSAEGVAASRDGTRWFHVKSHLGGYPVLLPEIAARKHCEAETKKLLARLYAEPQEMKG